jgi:hypothetical protein
VACHAKKKRSLKDGSAAAESSSLIEFSHFDALAAKPEHRGVCMLSVCLPIGSNRPTTL